MTSVVLDKTVAPLRLDPKRTAILLDIDGTLAPIVEQASDAHVPQGTRRVLAQLARSYGVVACVSGRRASEARAMVGVGSITYLGSHGSELLEAGWTEAVLDPALAEWAERVEEFGRDLDSRDLQRRRVRVEDKGPILALHWRGAPDEDAARSALETVADRAHAEGLRTHWGRKVLEVRPPVRIDKGTAVLRLLEESDVTGALYVGDDATDLDAFRALRELSADGRLAHAVNVGVASDDGPEQITRDADLVVDGTGGVLELLELLAASGPGDGPGGVGG